MMRSLAVFRLLAALFLAVLLGACGTLEQKDETIGWSASKLFSEAKDAQADAAWDKAAKLFEKLEARFPYGRFAQQAQLELGYTYWKAGEAGSALAACDRFIKLHPNHPAVDYVYYLKGLINFNEDLGLLGYIGGQELAERDPKGAREAFDSFREVVTRFPNSKYAADSAQRMNYLVNSMAIQEVNVARYYMRRSAYLAAANRAQYALKTYPGAPALEEALFIMVVAYDKLGMTDLREDAERVMRMNFPQSRYFAEGLEKKTAWWKLW